MVELAPTVLLVVLMEEQLSEMATSRMVTPRGDIYGWRLEDDRSSAMADICRMEPMAAMAR